MLKPMEIKVGVPYRGSGVLNDYGQWMFTPSQVGSREGQKRLVKAEKDYKLYTTKNKVIIHISLDRDEKIELMKQVTLLSDRLFIDFKNYDFRRILPNKNKGQKDKRGKVGSRN